MSDSPGEPRFGEPSERATRQVAASDWNRAEIEAMPAPTTPRERLFSRKVMVGWALFAIVAYFGVQVAKTAVKASVRQAVEAGTLTSTQTKDGIVIETRNGTRVTIRRDGPGSPSVTVGDQTPTVTRTTRTTPTTATERTTVTTPTKPTATTRSTTAPAEPPPIPPEPKKR